MDIEWLANITSDQRGDIKVHLARDAPVRRPHPQARTLDHRRVLPCTALALKDCIYPICKPGIALPN